MVSILNLRQEKPQNDWDVRVDRSSVLGNLFHMKVESERNDVCEKYDKYFQTQLTNNPTFKAEIDRLVALYRKHGKLNLFCWCTPKRCHSETVRKYIVNLIAQDGTKTKMP